MGAMRASVVPTAVSSALTAHHAHRTHAQPDPVAGEAGHRHAALVEGEAQRGEAGIDSEVLAHQDRRPVDDRALDHQRQEAQQAKADGGRVGQAKCEPERPLSTSARQEEARRRELDREAEQRP